MGPNKGILQGALVIYLLTVGALTTIALAGYGLSFLAPSAAHAADFPMCMGKTCTHGTCTKDWGGGQPLTKRGICQCQKYGGTAFIAPGVKAKRAC